MPNPNYDRHNYQDDETINDASRLVAVEKRLLTIEDRLQQLDLENDHQTKRLDSQKKALQIAVCCYGVGIIAGIFLLGYRFEDPAVKGAVEKIAVAGIVGGMGVTGLSLQGMKAE